MHAAADLGVGDAGIMLGGADILMVEHLANCFDKDAVGQCYGCGEDTAGDVVRENLGPAEGFHNFIKVSIGFLAADAGHEIFAFGDTGGFCNGP